MVKEYDNLTKIFNIQDYNEFLILNKKQKFFLSSGNFSFMSVFSETTESTIIFLLHVDIKSLSEAIGLKAIIVWQGVYKGKFKLGLASSRKSIISFFLDFDNFLPFLL